MCTDHEKKVDNSIDHGGFFDRDVFHSDRIFNAVWGIEKNFEAA